MPKTFKLSSTVVYYNGKAIKPTLKITDAKGKVISTKNYSVSYSNNKKIGTGKVKIVFKGNYSGTKTLNFTIKPKVNKTSVSLLFGQTSQLSTKSSSKVTYKSSNSKVATVNTKGKITAIKKGTVTITVTSGKFSQKVKVTVSNPYIKLNKKSATLLKGESIKLTATKLPANSKITWKSSNTKVATVSGGTVKGIKDGTATITASISYKGKTYKTTCKITVKKAADIYDIGARTELIVYNYLKNPSSYTVNNMFYKNNALIVDIADGKSKASSRYGTKFYLWYKATNSYGGYIDGYAEAWFSKTKSAVYYSVPCTGGYVIVDTTISYIGSTTGEVDIEKVQAKTEKLGRQIYYIGSLC